MTEARPRASCRGPTRAAGRWREDRVESHAEVAVAYAVRRRSVRAHEAPPMTSAAAPGTTDRLRYMEDAAARWTPAPWNPLSAASTSRAK